MNSTGRARAFVTVFSLMTNVVCVIVVVVGRTTPSGHSAESGLAPAMLGTSSGAEGGPFARTEGGTSTRQVSLVEVLTMGASLAGTSVFVSGYLCRDWSGDGLYLSEADCLHGVLGNAIAVEFPRDGRFDSVRSGYVMLEGTVIGQQVGAFGGALYWVQRVVPLARVTSPMDSSGRHPIMPIP